jgi:integrase
MAKLKASYRILSVTNRSGTRSYQVSGTNPEGQRVRKAFTSRDEATRYRQKLESDQPETAETFARTALSADQLSDASVAFGLLGSNPPTTLVAAVKHWLQNPPPKRRKGTVSEVRKLFLEEKHSENLVQRTLKELELMTGKIASKYGRRQISDLNTEDIKKLFRDDWNPRTRVNHITKFSQLFHWAITKRYMSSNPVDELKKPRIQRARPVVFSWEQINTLLRCAWNTPLQNIIAIRLFCGFRAAEANQLDWTMFDWDEGAIYADKTKKRIHRDVHFHPLLCKWLNTKKPIVPVSRITHQFSAHSFVKRFLKFRKRAGISNRKYDNALRHTCLTYHHAKTKSLEETAMWGGTSPGRLKINYLGRILQKDVSKFWNLTPESLGL